MPYEKEHHTISASFESQRTFIYSNILSAIAHSRLYLVSSSHPDQSCILLFCCLRSWNSRKITGCIWWKSTWVPVPHQNPSAYIFFFSIASCILSNSWSPRKTDRATQPRFQSFGGQVSWHAFYYYYTHIFIFRLYCGFEDAIEVFDFAFPGEGTRLPTTPSKKSKDGLKGTPPLSHLQNT